MLIQARDLPRKVLQALGLAPSLSRRDNDRWRDDPEYAAKQRHLKKHPHCALRRMQCDGERQVHHIYPVHLYPELRLAEEHFLTVCEKHHLVIAHGGDWSGWEPNLLAIIDEIRKWGCIGPITLNRIARERTFARAVEVPITGVEAAK